MSEISAGRVGHLDDQRIAARLVDLHRSSKTSFDLHTNISALAATRIV